MKVLTKDEAALVRRILSSVFDFEAHVERQRAWSERTFGPGPRTAGVIDHIRKELREIEAAPADLSEWIDVVILALDGAWRAGHSPEDIVNALQAKQAKNEARTRPDWRTAPADKAIEHDRSRDLVAGTRVRSRANPDEVGDLVEVVSDGTHRARVRWDHITSGSIAHVRLSEIEVQP